MSVSFELGLQGGNKKRAFGLRSEPKRWLWGARRRFFGGSLLCCCLKQFFPFLEKSCERSGFGWVVLGCTKRSALGPKPCFLFVAKRKLSWRSGKTFFGRKLTLFLSKQHFFFSNLLLKKSVCVNEAVFLLRSAVKEVGALCVEQNESLGVVFYSFQ